MKKYNNPSYKRKADTTSVGDAITDMLKSYNLTERFDEKRLVESWEKIMGRAVANRTTKIFIRNKVLFIELSSAPLKKELSLSKDKLFNLFEREVGQGIVAEIVLI